MSVSTLHNDYSKYLPRWKKVRDCTGGEDDVKAEKTTYLPMPNASDLSVENKDRYNQYLQRARFVNFTGRTGFNLLGMIFRKDPVVELPSEVEYLKADTDGGGLSLTQMAKAAIKDINETSRSGLLVDYPKIEAGATLDATKGVKARILPYNTESIINWREERKDGKTKLTLVTLMELEGEYSNLFESVQKKKYRVLYLDNGVYTQDVYSEEESIINDESGVIPRQSDGSTWDEIPFVFIGSEENSPKIDTAPLYDIANVNIGHYINSADYEEAVYMHGQGTLFFTTDLSQSFFDDANPNGIKVGAREGHNLGTAGSAELLQLGSNTAAREAMQDKEQQIIMLGGKVVSYVGKQQTAEEARINATAETSILSTITDNASEGIKKGLQFACMFMGADPEKVEFQLNKDFFDKSLTAQEIMAITQLADRGDIAQSDVRYNLRRAGFFKAGRLDKDIDQDVAENPPLMNFGDPMPSGEE